MSMHKKKILRNAVMVICVLALLLLGSSLVFGWGLKRSNVKASYEFLEYWTEAAGQDFEEPFAIAVDRRNGNVLFTDSRNQRVIIFDGTGNLIREFGTEGDEPGQFSSPTGIAVGPDGAIYVADYNQDRIQKFSNGGEFLLSWGSSGQGNDEFDSPNERLSRGRDQQRLCLRLL